MCSRCWPACAPIATGSSAVWRMIQTWAPMRCATSFASGESAFANFIADALAFQARAHGYPVDFAMIDASSVGCGLPVGKPMTFGDWFEVMPFADTLCLVRLSGRELLTLLQDNAQRLDRPGQPHTERGFLHFSREVRYAIRLDAASDSAQAEDICSWTDSPSALSGSHLPDGDHQFRPGSCWRMGGACSNAARTSAVRSPAVAAGIHRAIRARSAGRHISRPTAGCCRKAARSGMAGCGLAS